MYTFLFKIIFVMVYLNTSLLHHLPFSAFSAKLLSHSPCDLAVPGFFQPQDFCTRSSFGQCVAGLTMAGSFHASSVSFIATFLAPLSVVPCSPRYVLVFHFLYFIHSSPV